MGFDSGLFRTKNQNSGSRLVHRTAALPQNRGSTTTAGPLKTKNASFFAQFDQSNMSGTDKLEFFDEMWQYIDKMSECRELGFGGFVEQWEEQMSTKTAFQPGSIGPERAAEGLARGAPQRDTISMSSILEHQLQNKYKDSNFRV